MNNTVIKCKKIEATRIQRICCPSCNTRFPRVGLLPSGELKGLSIKCRECGTLFSAETEKTRN